jgi:hypothetical protein
VLGQVGDGSANLAVLGRNALVVETRLAKGGLDSNAKSVLVGGKSMHGIMVLGVLGQDTTNILLGAGEDTLVARLNADETFDLATHKVQLVVHIGLVTRGRTGHRVLGGLNRVRSVLLLLRPGLLRREGAEARLGVVDIGWSHGGHLAASLGIVIAVDSKGGAVVVDGVSGAIAEIDAQAIILEVALTKRGAARRRTSGTSTRHVAKRARNGAGMFILETPVAVALVSRSVNNGRNLVGGNVLLLSASGGKVVSKDRSLHAVTFEDMILGTVDVVFVLNSTNVLDRLDRKSSVGLLAIVDGRVRRNNRSSLKLLGSNTVGISLIRLLVVVGRRIEGCKKVNEI